MENLGQEGAVSQPNYERIAEQVNKRELLESDRLLLEGFTSYSYTDEDMERLAAHFELAIRPLPRGDAAPTPQIIEAKDHRRLFFERGRFEWVEQAGRPHALFSALQSFKNQNKGNYPSPFNFIRNARLLQAFDADVPQAFRRNSKFFTASIDTQNLAKFDQILQPYGLSLAQSPGLLIVKPETLDIYLQRFSQALQVTKLPLTVAEVVSKYPNIVYESPSRQTTLALLLARHGDLRAYIRSRKAPPGELRNKLISDIGVMTFLPLEGPLGSVAETGKMTVAGVRYFLEPFRRAPAMRRIRLFELLKDEKKAAFVGEEVLRAYFEGKPPTSDELRIYPNLAPYIPATRESPVSQAAPRKRRQPYTAEAAFTEKNVAWLSELANRELSAEERNQAISVLNNSFESRDTSISHDMHRQWLVFFDNLGWSTPGHPMYESYAHARGPQQDRIVSPLKVAELARLLARASEGVMTRILAVSLGLTEPLQQAPQQQSQKIQPQTLPPQSAKAKAVTQPSPSARRPARPSGRIEATSEANNAPAAKQGTQQAEPQPQQTEPQVFENVHDEVVAIRRGLGLNVSRNDTPTMVPPDRRDAYTILSNNLRGIQSVDELAYVPDLSKLSPEDLGQLTKEAAKLYRQGEELGIRWLARQVSKYNIDTPKE